MLDVETVFDRLELRCPRLGGDVTFEYCRRVADGLPCARSLICWETAFPVARYMTGILTPEEWKQVFEQPPRSRIDTILDAASKAEETPE